MNGDLFPAATKHDPGGRLLPLPPDVEGWAVFGRLADCYRYRLGRHWDASRPFVLFVGMNPSTADPLFDDPTVAKVCRMARRWGYGGLLVGNVHAYRCTDQARLAETDDPCGPENDAHLLAMAAEATLIVMAYGTPRIPALRQRGPQVARMLAEAGHTLHELRLSKDGTPVHPLYLPDATMPALWMLAC
jgi:hypothetical protein